MLNDDLNIFEGWGTVINDWLLPFNSSITSQDIHDTFMQARGWPVIFQHIRGNFHVFDPNGHCSGYGGGKHWAAFALRRCFAIYSILKETATDMRGSLPDFEFVYDLGDLPLWGSTNAAPNHRSMPGFGAIRCWEKGFMSFPMFGSHEHWDIRDIDEENARILNRTPRPFAHRRSAAVFRGESKGCSFPPEHSDMLNWHSHEFGNFYKGAPCGRHKLQVISQERPDLVNFAFTEAEKPNMSLEQQENSFKYIVSIEGNGGWADRLSQLMFHNVGVIVQEHPCKEWYEEMFRPFQHYIPVSNDLSNLLGRISWAEHHPEQVENMIRAKIARAKKVLSKQGIVTFSNVLWTRYAVLQRYPITLRNGTVALADLFQKNHNGSFQTGN